MDLDCDCGTTVLDTVDYNPCKVLFGKDQRWIFQKKDDANNVFVNGANGIEEESSWSALPDASNDTKVVVTPILEEAVFNEGDKLEDGENPDGAPNAVAAGPQLVTGMIRNITPDQFEQLEKLKCFDEELTFYRLDKNGKIGAKLSGSADHVGIPISPNTFLIRDPSRGGTRVDQYKAIIEFYLPAGWYKKFAVVSPEDGFDPLSEIKPS